MGSSWRRMAAVSAAHKLSYARTQIALAEASAIAIFCRWERRRPPLCEAKCLGFCLFGLVLIALRFELRVLIRSQDALGVLHKLRLAGIRAPRLVVFGHQRIHLRLLICCQVESRKSGRTGHLPFVPSLFRAIAVFTREHCSRCKCARRH